MMTTTKVRIAKRILINRYTKTSAKRLQGFLNRNLDGGKSSGLSQTKATSFRARLLKTEDMLRKTRNKAETYRTRLLNTQQILRDTRQQAVKLRAQAEGKPHNTSADGVVGQLLRGASIEQALIKVVKSRATTRERMVGRSLGFRLFDQAETRQMGALLLGVFMYDDELYETSLSYFREIDEEIVLKNAQQEYFGAWLSVDPEAGRKALLAYIAVHEADMSPAQATGLSELFIKHRYYDDLRRMMKTVPCLVSPPDDIDENVLQKITWVQTRLAAADVPAPQIVPDQINFAIMDYKLLDRSRTSSNRGDYVQTLASLANICRFQNVKFAGDTPLAQQLETLKSDIHPDRRLDTPVANVVPIALDRDYASGRQYQPNTWLICNGWFMHRNFRGVIDFPFPEEINPIFISFHINDPDVLTPETAAELRKYEPIGCRDWTTIYRLRDYGVSCFFSGCLTTTIGQILPKAENLPPKHLASVESPVEAADYEGWQVTNSSQIGDYVRDFSLTEGIQDARDMLISYLAYSKIQTSRLHCYLPCRSMGFEVDFRPKNRSDIRFEGLLDLNPEDFTAIRTGIEAKLEIILAAIFSKQSKEEVMELWRQICAPDVVAAEAYYEAPLPAVPTVDVPAILQMIPRHSPRPLHENAVELAFALDQNLADYLPAVLHSVAANTTRPTNVNLIYRGLDQDYLTTLVAAFPEMAFQLFDFSRIDYGNDLRLLSHTTQATLDRLYLPELLPNAGKIIYLDIDLLVRADLSSIFDLDLGDNVLAGKLSNLPSWQNAVRLMSRASLKLPPEGAWTMRRRLHKQMNVPAHTFNAGLILMNLALMRAESFTSRYLYLVTDCYCNDQDVLNIYAAGRVMELSPTWNYVPAQDYDRDPNLIHWAGSAKPWSTTTHSLWQAEFQAAMNAGLHRMRDARSSTG